MVISLDSAGVVVAIIAGISAIVWEYFRVLLKLDTSIRDTADAIRNEIAVQQKEKECILNNHSGRIQTLESKMGIFWNSIGGVMSSLVKQPVHHRKDFLMDKLIPEVEDLPESSDEELLELRSILQEEISSLKLTKDPKVLAYALAVGYIEQILFDRGQLFRGV